MTETLFSNEQSDELLSDRLLYSVLYDYYGELLSEHNREIFEGYVLEDLSLGELAESMDISRQGIRDSVNRSKKQLLLYEEKLHMVDKAKQADELLKKLRESIKTAVKNERDINDICEEIDSISKLLL